MPSKIYEKDYKDVLIKSFDENNIIHKQCEFGLCNHEARIDIFVIDKDKMFHGYEIKTAMDSLSRLKTQMTIYNNVFDYINIVIPEIHYQKVKKIIPWFWGIIIMNELTMQFRYASMPKLNNFNLNVFARYLWRKEAKELLRKQGRIVSRGYSNKSKNTIINRLVEIMDRDELIKEVREIVIRGRILNKNLT